MRDALGFARDLKKATRVFRVYVQPKEPEGLPEELAEFADVFDYDDIINLPQPEGAEHAINLELG